MAGTPGGTWILCGATMGHPRRPVVKSTAIGIALHAPDTNFNNHLRPRAPVGY